jgi:hypothetical protein
MSRTIEISQTETWVGPILQAASVAEPGDTIVVHSHAQDSFLHSQLLEIGKRGVKTINTRRRHPAARPYDDRDPLENAEKLYAWIQSQAHAARQKV